MASAEPSRREERWRRRLDPSYKSPREPITVPRIVDAALAVMAVDGYQAVSMRRVAQALSTGPASLYAHVENKEDLDALMVDRLAATISVPLADPDRWSEQLVQVARDLRAAMAEYPGIARAVMAHVPTGTEALRMSEGLLAIMLAGGLTEQVAAWACDLLPLYVTAVAFEDNIRATEAGATSGADGGAQFAAELRTYFESLPSAQFPHLVASAAALTAGQGDERFEFGLQVLVAGLKAVSDSWPPSPTN